MVRYDHGLVVIGRHAAPPTIDGVDERLADDVRRPRRDNRHLRPILCCYLRLASLLQGGG